MKKKKKKNKIKIGGVDRRQQNRKELKKMKYRTPVKPKKDSKVFKITAQKTKKINVNPKVSRGGIRL